MDRFDVIVVGAGLAGLSCARWLAERGKRVLLVDRKSRVDQSIHTTGIFVRRTLEDFALPEHCLGPTVRDVRLYSPRRRVLALSSPHDEFRVGKMGPLYQHLLRSALQQLREKLPRITGRQHLSTAGLAAVSVKVALWQPGQLDQELQGGLWFNVPANPQRMLNEAVPPWHELVREVGRSVYRDALGISEFPANVWLN